MRFPDVILLLVGLQRRVRALERELEFHHGQFRAAVQNVPHYLSLLEEAEQFVDKSTNPVDPVATTLVAVGDKKEVIPDGSQDPTLF